MFYDPWFYTTLLLLTGYIILAVIGYWIARPYVHLARQMKRAQRASTLRDKLQQIR